MPPAGENANALDVRTLKPCSRRSLSSVKNGSDKILAFDAAISLDAKMSAVWYSHAMDGWALRWSHGWIDDPANTTLDDLLPPGQASVSNSVTNLVMYNIDPGTWSQSYVMRYRHMGNTAQQSCIAMATRRRARR